MASIQLRKVFVMESEDRLQQMEAALLQLEKDPQDQEAINVLFRAAHTIKGSAGVVGLEEVSRFMHVLENTLDDVRGGSLEVTGDFVELLLSCHDFVTDWLNHAAESDELDPEIEQTKQDLLKGIEAFARGENASPPSPAPKPAATPAQPEVSAPPADTSNDTFHNDSAKLLQNMEELFARLTRERDNLDVWQNITRCARDLKNVTKLAGFDAILRLSLELENLLSRQSASGQPPTVACVETLKKCHHMMVEVHRFSKAHPEAAHADQLPSELTNNLDKILRELRDFDFSGGTPPTGKPPLAGADQSMVTHTTPVMEDSHYAVEMENWHISLRFRSDALRKGVEPLETLRYLRQHGTILHLSTLFETMPAVEELEPDTCYVGCELGFKTDLGKSGIENLFELIQEDCDVCILPPHSQLSHYIDLIRELPEDTMKLGEILMQIGTLTQRELELGLNLQQAAFSESMEGEEGGKTPLGQILVEHGVVQPDVVDAAVDKQQRVRQYQLSKQRALHVDAQKLDQLIDLVGELVITNASMKLLTQDLNDERLKKVAVMMSRLVEEIRNRTLGMRMVPIGDTFSRFHRLVRDLCESLGKQVDLQIFGSETELDKSMVEKIGDPLMHIIRNAIDHGIERSQERIALGKPATGTLQLNAYHDSGSIVIEVTDDGRGMSADRILAAAIEKGLAKAEHEYSEQEIYNFIFEPGLSTAESVTQVSGRGVGLDVVKRNISALNGVTNIDSEEGLGTTMQLYLPLTLAIIDGFLLSVGGSSFVVPLDRVVRCIKYTQTYVEESAKGYINLRGKVLPLLRLHRLFEIEGETAGKHRNIVVVRYGNQEAGLLVDALLGEFQAVIKPLGKIFERMPGISGATILGNGEVALILDVPALVQRYSALLEREKNDNRKSLPASAQVTHSAQKTNRTALPAPS